MLASAENSSFNSKQSKELKQHDSNIDSLNDANGNKVDLKGINLNGNKNSFMSPYDLAGKMISKRTIEKTQEANPENSIDRTDNEEFDGLVYKDYNNSLNTLKMLNVLRKNRQLCDLILQLNEDSQEIYCHQVILACNSKFFMEIFNNHEMEQTKQESSSEPSSGDPSLDENRPATNTAPTRTDSLKAIVNKNHNTSRRQLLLCLSDYLRNYLSESNYHHHAKINNVVNHNSQYHHYHYHHINGTNNHSIDNKTSASHDQDTNHINHNLDFEALKLCIDYMYTSKLRVPSYLLPHVYTLAYHLSMDSIVEACAAYLTKHLTVDNCLSIRSFALDENLIQASTQCIEKNIDYILRLGPNRSISSSNSSLISQNGFTNGNTVTSLQDELASQASILSSSLNLANKEFNHLPRINIELVGMKSNKYKLPESILYLTELCMNWLFNELTDKQPDQNLGDLCDHLRMLYMNSTDHTLHDFCDMDSSDCNYTDYINDYQKHHNQKHNANLTNPQSKQNGTVTHLPVSIQNSRSPSPFSTSNRLKTFKITDRELNAIGTATPIKVKVLHDNEVVCTHQTSENSFITICTLTGKLVTLSVHLLPAQVNQNNDEAFLSNGESSTANGAITNGETRGDADTNRTLFRLGSIENSVESQFSLDQQSIGSDLNQGRLNSKSDNSSTSATSTNANAPNASSTNLVSLDSMEKLPKMSVARCSHGLIAYDNKLYIIGGYDRGECLDTCEVYDPVTNKLNTFGSMVSRRGRAAISWFARDNSIYVMGGSDGHEDLNSLEIYNTEKRAWSMVKFDFDLSCSNLATTACQNYIYLVGLKGDGGKSLSRSSCLKYDPVENQFIRMAELNHGRSQSALVLVPFKSRSNNSSNEAINNMSGEQSRASFYLFVFGGHDQIRCLSSCEVYDAKEDKWTLISSMHESRRGCGAAYNPQTKCIYIVGGTNGSQSLKSVEIYDTVTKKWSMGPDLNIARTNVAIAFLGNVLFAVGGFNGKTFLRTIEYLDVNDTNLSWSMYHKPAVFELFSKTNSD